MSLYLVAGRLFLFRPSRALPGSALTLGAKALAKSCQKLQDKEKGELLRPEPQRWSELRRNAKSTVDFLLARN